ncbi:MAG: sugar phosphate nucleotidyltransferase [Dehalococcoidia bacterium]
MTEGGFADKELSAVILVGGGGTRLRPLTYAIPKPLIPVLNRPLIVHMLDNLRRHGVKRIVLAASASDKRMEAALGDGSEYGVNLEYCYETEPLGSGLAVKEAARRFEGPFFVCNGDVLADLNLTEMAARHVEAGAMMSIFLASVSDPSSYGIADVDDGGRISRFLEKPGPGQTSSRWANAGTWLFEPAVLNQIPDEKMDGSIERLVMPSLIAQGDLVLGFASDTYWMDVGTPQRYLQIHSDLLSGSIPAWVSTTIDSEAEIGEGCQIWADAQLGERVILGANCRVGGQVKISGPTVIGDNCAIREHAVIDASVLWNDVKIGAGAVVRDSIIGEGCVIGDGCVIEGSVLANGAKVKREIHLSGARLEPDEIAG